MKYTQPSFSVPASGENKLPCAHGWIDHKRGRCVLCGEGGFIPDGGREAVRWTAMNPASPGYSGAPCE